MDRRRFTERTRPDRVVSVSRRPGRPKLSRVDRSEIARLTAEVERLSVTIVEQAVELA